jgi:hypothetical protein
MVARVVLGHNRSEAKGGGERLSGMRNSVSRPWLLSFANMKRRPDSWKEKVHPLFIEIAGVYRDSVKEWLALGRPPAEKAAQVEARLRQKTAAIRTRYAKTDYTPTTTDPLDTILVSGEPSSWPPTKSETDQGFLELLYWKRFGEPLWIALQKSESGDLEALRRVNRVAEDHERLRFGKGPIKAAKGDPDHAALLEFGLDLGLSILVPEELADCFDALCPCGKVHDADALKKQRSRKQKAIQKAISWLAAERAKMSTREWMAAYGMHGLYAKGVPSISGVLRRVYVGRMGEPACCYIDEQGDVVVLQGSKLANSSVAQELPRAFGVSSSKEIFAMFFFGTFDR